MPQVDYLALPSELVGEIGAYVRFGRPPSRRVRLMLENDFTRAILSVPVFEIEELRGVAEWLRHDAPKLCWGSEQAVSDWISSGGLEGRKERRGAA